MRERFNRRAWKARVGVTPLPRVRIPLSPPAPSGRRPEEPTSREGVGPSLALSLESPAIQAHRPVARGADVERGRRSFACAQSRIPRDPGPSTRGPEEPTSREGVGPSLALSLESPAIQAHRPVGPRSRRRERASVLRLRSVSNPPGFSAVAPTAAAIQRPPALRTIARHGLPPTVGATLVASLRAAGSALARRFVARALPSAAEEGTH